MVESITFEIETERRGKGEMTLGVKQAQDWCDQIEDQLENGPGGVVRIKTIKPDGELLIFELPPLEAEDFKESIEGEL